MGKHLKIFIFFIIYIISFNKALKLDNDEIIKRIESIINNKNSPLLAGGLSVIKGNKTLICKSIGKARLNEDGSENKTATEFVKYRTASISKLFTAVAIWQLEEKGLLNVTDEASKYLNFTLRNPNFPDSPITIEMLLSHTSSIAESDSNYNIPYNHHISEFFNNESEIYYEGSYSKTSYPGYYDYMNINYCLLGTIIEIVSKKRFDLYMIENVLTPLNITGSFNIYEMPKEHLDEVGTIYRKLTKGEFDINGTWTPQMDNFIDGYPKANYSEYVIGTNGALYGPMGSLRVSLSELTNLVYMFLNNGTYNGNTILKPETIEKMFKIIWKYDPEKKNGNTAHDYDYVYGGGPAYITNIGRNRIHEKKNLYFWGHTANAYGLFGGLFFDRVKGYGLVYRGNGVSIDLDKNVYDFSPFNKWAIDFIKLADEIAQFDYPEIDDETNDNDKGDNSYIIYIVVAVVIVIILALIIIYFVRNHDKKGTKNEKEGGEKLLKDS
jgi:CubicO group peptidase (beta-lactamase class C family)